ncbi:TPA: substrate-binding domain-containing protein [Enterococcus faecium]|nr:substrate-binding domain-containing protein [Enterococcus faecium]
MVAKLTDVAELAGVSPTTVSRVINNKGYLSEKTKQKMEIKSTIINHKPDGIFVSDDLTAILTMKIAHQLKLNIPEDLKIIGYDGTSFIEKFFPQLTTIRQPIDEIASLIVDILLKKIKGEKTNKDYILPISILSGGSI